jgi:hypothetical protein
MIEFEESTPEMRLTEPRRLKIGLHSSHQFVNRAYIAEITRQLLWHRQTGYEDRNGFQI